MAEVKVKNLSEKIATIAQEIGAIAKDGKNKQQGYAFIEYAQVAARARELQAKYGVAIIPTVKSYETSEVKNKFGGIGYHYLIEMEFTVINADDQDDKITTSWIGEATDYGDKGINKAITSGVKYFIMRLYNISEKGEQEADSVTPEVNVASNSNVRSVDAETSTEENSVKVDFKRVNEIRAKVATIDSVEELENYWRELNLDYQYKRILTRRFQERKKQIAPEEIDDGE